MRCTRGRHPLPDCSANNSVISSVIGKGQPAGAGQSDCPSNERRRRGNKFARISRLTSSWVAEWQIQAICNNEGEELSRFRLLSFPNILPNFLVVHHAIHYHRPTDWRTDSTIFTLSDETPTLWWGSQLSSMGATDADNGKSFRLKIRNSFMKYLANKFIESCRDGPTFRGLGGGGVGGRREAITTWLIRPRTVKAIDRNHLDWTGRWFPGALK